ncbi:MAG: type IV toxin-antitoxin system AbiEi family antitoxin [Anaerolineales bacterium]|jgi:hypothetical protein
MVKIKDLEAKAKDALFECLQDVPFLEIKEVALEPTLGDIRPVLRATVRVEGDIRTIVAEVKNNGEPRYARQAVNQLFRYLESSPDDYGVFIAPYVSTEAGEICRESGIGYIDLAGNGYISFGRVYINKQGNPNPYTRKRYLKSLYSPKAERILRVLLLSGPREWKVEALANEAEVSLGQVSNVKKLLEDREWIDAQTIGFSLIEPFAMLEEWSENYNFRRNQARDYYSMLSIPEFEERLGKICESENVPYGLSGFSGAARLAPAVRYQRAMVYVQAEYQKLTQPLGLKPVTSGANVTLLQPYDEGVFYGSQDRGGTQVVSSVQVYLDLKNIRGRGEEAAQAILDQVIREIW